MRVLVTGGAGFIGSVASKLLLKAGHEVVVFDNLSQGHHAAMPKEATFKQGDLADLSAIRLAFATHCPEGVMHFASRTLVWARP